MNRPPIKEYERLPPPAEAGMSNATNETIIL